MVDFGSQISLKIGNNNLLDNNKKSNMKISKTTKLKEVKYKDNVKEISLLPTSKIFKETQTISECINQTGDLANAPLLSPSIFLAKTKNCKQNVTLSNTMFTADDPGLVIVKFCINKEVFATSFKALTTIKAIKESLANVLDLKEDLIALEINNNDVEPTLTLRDLGAQAYSKINIQLNSTNGEEGKKVVEEKVRENIPTLDVITVHLGDQHNNQELVVEIENQCCTKQWLGGYRNKITSIEYHNAQTQTPGKKREVFAFTDTGEAVPLLYHRDTQTPFKLKTAKNSTVVNKTTQMARSDLYVNPKSDRIMTARPYLCYKDIFKFDIREKAVMIIQRAVKEWIRGRRIKQLTYIQKILLADMRKQRQQIVQEQADKERIIITGAAYPVKRDDFYMLYLMVSNWWKREWKRICNLRTKEPKKSEAAMLLAQEVKLLESIERHRIKGKKEALRKQTMRFLENTSRPFIFTNSKGDMTSFDDRNSQKAGEFKEIYSALTRKDILPKDKIDVLLTVQNLFVLHFMDYEFADDLISLIEREVDLLAIGTKLNDLQGLDKRIEQLYIHFLQQKEFNPKAGIYKKPNMPKTFHKMFKCNRCLKLLPVSKYPVHVRMTAYTECKSCVWLQNIGQKRVDMSPYLKLLKIVQNSEMEKCCYSAVCFILQPIGMGYLTNRIWHGHSAISECSDLSKLQHIRWLSDVEWAPWNTILVTDQEARCHECISNVFEFYEKPFIENVRQKHILARDCFIPLLIMNHDICSSRVWESITDSGAFLHPSHVTEITAFTDFDKI